MIVPLNRSPAPVHPGFFFGQILDKFSRIFLFGKIDFNPEKIFSGIWIIPIFGFTFVPGRRAVNATEVASFQGNSGKSDPKTESFTLWTVPFWDFAFMPWQNQIILKTKNKNQNGLHRRIMFIYSGEFERRRRDKRARARTSKSRNN